MAKKRQELAQPLDQIATLVDLADELSQSTAALEGRPAVRARDGLEELMARIRAIIVSLDPVRKPGSVFNPSSPRTVGLFVSIALLAQDREPLGGVKPVYGSGVYALYYGGDFPAYRPLVGTEHPIYVGKADPASAEAKTPEEQGERLSRRVREHAKTIRKAAANLDIEDFTCRYLVVASGLQTAAEDYLIQLFKPIWNKELKIAYGIGKHGDAPTTRANQRSPWDTLHQGREWAHRDPRMKDQSSSTEIVKKIGAHFAANPPFGNIDAVLREFYKDLKQQ